MQEIYCYDHFKHELEKYSRDYRILIIRNMLESDEDSINYAKMYMEETEGVLECLMKLQRRK